MDAVDARRMPAAAPGREIGSVIAGVFGLVFVLVNSAGLTLGIRVPLLVAAAAALVAVLVLSYRDFRRSLADTAEEDQAPRSPVFGWRYWTVVAIEAVALFGGTRLISGLGHPELGIAWVAVVVGTHFFALGRIFRLARFHLLAVIVTCCGLAGFGLDALDARTLIPVVSGVASGFVLFGFALWALLTRRDERPTVGTPPSAG